MQKAPEPHQHVLRARRAGSALVEVAFIAPLTLLLVIGILIAGIGVLRYQQVATLACEGARWASVHGPQYEKMTNSAPITENDVFQNAIKPLASSSNPKDFVVDLEWGPDRTTVTVSVQYLWVPQAFLQPVTLVGRSEMPVVN